MSVYTVDTLYADHPEVAAAYLIIEGDEAAFVETNTARAVPRLLAALEVHGLTPEAVRYVIITHVHLDHAGGAGALLAACPHATLLAHPRAARHAIDPSRLEVSAREVYGDETFDALYGALTPVPPERVRVMADGEALAWGGRTLTFHHTRGHANHHFVIHDDREDCVFTGDAFGIAYPHVQRGGRWVFPSTSPTDFDGPAAIAAVRAIVATGARRAWPTHYGALEDLPGVADELIAELERYSALVEEADASGLEGAALDAMCAERVGGWFEAALAARGLSDDALARALTDLDRDLNAQGVAFAVRKRRYKRRAT